MTAAPLAPVPEESVSPTPRSKIRARTRLPSIARKETLVRLGKSSWPSISGPIALEVEVLELLADDDRALRVADRDVLELPLAPAGLERAACRPSPPEGKSFEVGRGPAHLDRAGQLAGDRRRDRPGRRCGSRSSSASVQPWRRR